MSQLAPLQLDDGTLIYIEATEDHAMVARRGPLVAVADPVLADSALAESESAPVEPARVGKGWHNSARVLQGAAIAPAHHRPQFQAIERTIQGYTQHTLNAFRQAALSGLSNVDKVTLEFGIQLSGEMGIPYITKGAAASNIKVTVECSFPKA